MIKYIRIIFLALLIIPVQAYAQQARCTVSGRVIDGMSSPDHGIWSHHFMGNGWGNSGNSVRLYFWGSKITADGTVAMKLKDTCSLEKNAITNLDSVLKSRDITLQTKVRLVEAMVFPVVMYGCESWIVKKAEHRRIDAFELIF